MHGDTEGTLRKTAQIETGRHTRSALQAAQLHRRHLLLFYELQHLRPYLRSPTEDIRRHHPPVLLPHIPQQSVPWRCGLRPRSPPRVRRVRDRMKKLYNLTAVTVNQRIMRRDRWGERTLSLWILDDSSIFAETEAVVQRCNDFMEICHGRIQFVTLLVRIRWGREEIAVYGYERYRSGTIPKRDQCYLRNTD